MPNPVMSKPGAWVYLEHGKYRFESENHHFDKPVIKDKITAKKYFRACELRGDLKKERTKPL